MAIKVIEAVGSDDATYSEISLFGDKKLNSSAKQQVQQDVGDYLVEQTLLAVSKARSPVEGAEYRPTLSPKYKKIKVADGLSDKPDMENSGSMLNALTWRPTEDGIQLGVFDPDQAAKADGHNQFSGRATPLPVRQWLPNSGEEYSKKIMIEAEKMVSEAIVETTDVKPDDFNNVETKSQLYSVLKDLFEELTSSEIRTAVLAIPELTTMLEELDLLDLL